MIRLTPRTASSAMSIIDLRRNGSGRVPPDERVRPRAPAESGWGREMGPNALENYLETKSVVTQLA